MKEFAPKADMRIFDRGIRRRLASMLRGDRRRIELAYSLQFAMPGTPVLRYGEEIGMGEDLTQPGREAIRTPMQWDSGPTAGFSPGTDGPLVRPVPRRGAYAPRSVNASQQRRDATSLLRWFEQLIRTLRECPEIGVGNVSVLDCPLPRGALVHRFDAPEGSILLLHNLSDAVVTVDLAAVLPEVGSRSGAHEVFSDAAYEPLGRRLDGLRLNGYGFRWIRLRPSS
jgi:maltose alpha-D-glucosyltransferase/alpha-amylase